MHPKLQLFVDEFEKHLKSTHRWNAFIRIAAELFSLERSVFIAETGSMRALGNWGGDGQSTLLWNFIAKHTNGCAFSIDSNPGAFEMVKTHCKNVIPFCDDSITMLTDLAGLVENLDLLYLDSMDYQGETALSELHHAGELAACYSKLKSGCLIAVDDCHTDDQGKHFLVKTFFDRMNIEPIVKSYITVWEKP